MKPRERAEALGWVRWTRNGRHVWRVPGMELFWSYTHETWSIYVRGAWLDFATEDEALAHALLLRDVVLS